MTLAALAAGLFLAQPAAIAASAEKGKQVFTRAGCWQCHGTMGQGGVAGPTLAPDPLPFDALASFVRTTNRTMPAYCEEILSDADLADLYADLLSIPRAPTRRLSRCSIDSGGDQEFARLVQRFNFVVVTRFPDRALPPKRVRAIDELRSAPKARQTAVPHGSLRPRISKLDFPDGQARRPDRDRG